VALFQDAERLVEVGDHARHRGLARAGVAGEDEVRRLLDGGQAAGDARAGELAGGDEALDFDFHRLETDHAA